MYNDILACLRVCNLTVLQIDALLNIQKLIVFMLLYVT